MPKINFIEYPSIIALRDAARNGFGDPDLAALYANRIRTNYFNHADSSTELVNNAITRSKMGDEEVPYLSAAEYENGGLVRFGGMKMLEDLERKFEQEIIKLGLMNKLPKPELTFNDRGLGNFVFDRAAQSLQYKYDYWSPTLERLVDDTEFTKVADDDEDAPPRFTLDADGSEVIRRVQQQENGLPAVVTANKKVFAYTPRNDKLSGGVELFVSAGNYHFSGTEFMYSGLVVILITKMLERAGIKVKITVVVGWMSALVVNYRPDYIANFNPDPVSAKRSQELFKLEIGAADARQRDTYCAALVTAKNFNESLDRNLLALVTSDPRFWQVEGYAICETIGKKFNRRTSYGLVGRALKGVLDVENYKPEMKHKFCYGRVQGDDEVIGEVKRAIEELAEFNDTMGNNVLQTDNKYVAPN